MRNAHRDLRLFVALVPPAQVAQGLLGAAADVAGARGLPPHRLLAADQLHLTLAFIGETRGKELPDIRESVERSCAGLSPFALTPLRLITIPTPEDGGPPRLLAAETDAPPTLLEIQRRLALRLTKPKKNGRRSRFLPHLTLMRYQQGQTSGAISEPLATAESWRVTACTLYASTLTASGSVYEVVHTVALE